MGLMNKKNKTKSSKIEYSVQVIKDSFTDNMVRELCFAEFNKLNSDIEEVIFINYSSGKEVLQMDKWPFVLKFDHNCKVMFVAYANKANGVIKIDCFIVDDIDSILKTKLSNSNGIIRFTR